MLKPKHEEMSDSTFFILLIIAFLFFVCSIVGIYTILGKLLNLFF